MNSRYVILVISAVGLFSPSSAQVAQTCAEGIQLCTQQFLRLALTDIRDKTMLCRHMNNFVQCISRQPCDFTEEMLQNLVVQTQAQLIERQTFTCKIEIPERKLIINEDEGFYATPLVTEIIARHPYCGLAIPTCIMGSSIPTAFTDDMEDKSSRAACRAFNEVLYCVLHVECVELSYSERNAIQQSSRTHYYQNNDCFISVSATAGCDTSRPVSILLSLLTVLLTLLIRSSW